MHSLCRSLSAIAAVITVHPTDRFVFIGFEGTVGSVCKKCKQLQTDIGQDMNGRSSADPSPACGSFWPFGYVQNALRTGFLWYLKPDGLFACRGTRRLGGSISPSWCSPPRGFLRHLSFAISLPAGFQKGFQIFLSFLLRLL
jgi:hypothetical protein